MNMGPVAELTRLSHALAVPGDKVYVFEASLAFLATHPSTHSFFMEVFESIGKWSTLFVSI
jgi:hypothetical protein